MYAEEQPASSPAQASDTPAVTEPTLPLAEPVLPDELHMRNVEEKVGLLKEKIFQAKARLLQLQEIFMHGGITGSQVALSYQNTMGPAFRLIKMECVLDGNVVYSSVSDVTKSDTIPDMLDVFQGRVSSGSHVLNVVMEYQGNGHGVLKYLNDYTFKVTSQYSFNAQQGMITYVKVVGYEKDDITLELKDRPSVRYELESLKGIRHIEKNNVDQKPIQQ